MGSRDLRSREDIPAKGDDFGTHLIPKLLIEEGVEPIRSRGFERLETLDG